MPRLPLRRWRNLGSHLSGLRSGQRVFSFAWSCRRRWFFAEVKFWTSVLSDEQHLTGGARIGRLRPNRWLRVGRDTATPDRATNGVLVRARTKRK